ncbi:MAG: tetratricopeptide repeat protein [Anaerolineales bacterium]
MAEDETPSTPKARSKASTGKGSGLTWLVIGVAVLVLLGIAGLGYAGVQAGRRERMQQIERTAEDLYQRGEAYREAGQLELAIAAYEQALLYVPDHKGANARLAEVQAQLEVQPTATPVLQQETKQAYWNQLLAAYETHAWDLVIQQADQLIAIDPTYNREQVDEMLVEAFYELGKALADQNQMVEAVRYFESALVIRPGDTRIVTAKELATRYMTAIGYWGADWEQAITHQEAVYVLDPEYKDVASRLYQAHVSYGDTLIATERWCEAAEQYTQALAFGSSAGLVAKNQDATLKCAQTPTPNPEGEAVESEPAVPGTYVGQVARVEDVASGQMYIRGQVLDAARVGVPGVQVKIQAFDWSATATTDANGLFSFDGLNNAVMYTLTLPSLPSRSVDVEGQWGKLHWVEFIQVE